MILPKDSFYRIQFLLKGHRKLILFTLLFVLLFIYSIYVLLPMSIFISQDYIKTSSLDICLENRLSKFKKKLDELDAVSFEPNGYSKYLPFIGNGYIGSSASSNDPLVLLIDKNRIVRTSIYPFLIPEVVNYFQQDKWLLDFSSGDFHKFQCYKQHSQASLCITCSSKYYAHRTRPELLIQKIRVHNPTKTAIQIKLIQQQFNNHKAILFKSLQIINHVEYNIYYEVIKDSNESVDGVLVVYAFPVTPTYLNVNIVGDESLQYIIGVKYQTIAATSSSQHITDVTASLAGQLTAVIKDALILSSNQLYNQHTYVWNKLWRTGISIEKSLAPNAINGDHINSTMYYLLSMSPAYLHQHNISDDKLKYYQQMSSKTSHCYNGHDTLNIPSLWQPVIDSYDRLLGQYRRWMLLLHKNGCGIMAKSGSDGLIQALVHSAGAFLYAGDHTSFGMQPSDLQRRLSFRQLRYYDKSQPNLSQPKLFRLSIDLDEENVPRMWVSIESPLANGALFACDAGCSDHPIQLTSTPIELPVKVTKPILPLMYLSSHSKHLNELRHVLHINSIEQVGPHQHHLIVLHRHGEATWAGLPPLFWVCISGLVIVFHLALIKLICNEYCRYKNDYEMTTNNSNISSGNSHNPRRYKYSSTSSDYHYMPSTRRTQYFSAASSNHNNQATHLTLY